MDGARERAVRERAHAIWEREGRPEGGAERHWAQAEEELRAEAPVVEATRTAGDAASTAGTETWTEPMTEEPGAADQGPAEAPAEAARAAPRARRGAGTGGG
jgi:Protein of unknown function (DUF2934)